MKISRGKRIVHFCNYSPLNSGIYPETRDLVMEELRLGYDAYMVDHIHNNSSRLDPGQHDAFFKTGRVIGIENDTVSDTADLICWHSFLPEKYRNDPAQNLVMFLHGMPSHVFYNELYGGEAVLSFLKRAEQDLPQCHFYISLWPTHQPFWENIFSQKLVVTKPIINCQAVQLKADTNFDPGHMRLVVMDTWRGGKEPYYIFNAVQRLMAQHAAGELSAKVSLGIYGQGADKVQPVWRAIVRDQFASCFEYKDRDEPQAIFDQHDILLTQVGEIPTESRVIREALLAGMPIVSGYAYDALTEFKHDCRDIVGYAHQILKCWNSLQDPQQRRYHRKQRHAQAVQAFDIRQNSPAIFACYEKIFSGETGYYDQTPPSVADNQSPRFSPAEENPPSDWPGPDYNKVKDLLCAAYQTAPQGDVFKTILGQLATDETMSKEESLVRMMMDLRN